MITNSTAVWEVTQTILLGPCFILIVGQTAQIEMAHLSKPQQSMSPIGEGCNTTGRTTTGTTHTRHMTSDKWHLTRDMWHLTCDTWWGVNSFSKFQLPLVELHLEGSAHVACAARLFPTYCWKYLLLSMKCCGSFRVEGIVVEIPGIVRFYW